MRLFKKLVLILLVVGCVPLAIASWFLIRTNVDALHTSIFERHHEQASSLARTMNLHLTHVTGTLAGQAARPDLAGMDAAALDEQARLMLSRHREDLNVVSVWRMDEAAPAAIAYFRASAAGNVASSEALTAGHLEAVSTTRPSTGEPVLSDVYVTHDGEAAVTVLSPASAGLVLAAEVRLAAIQEEVDRMRVGPGGNAFVVDGRGRVVASKDRSQVLARADLSGNELVRRSQGGQLSGTSDYVDGDGHEWLAAFAPAKRFAWTAIVQEPRAVAFAPASRMIRSTTAIAVLTLLAATLAGIVFARGVVAPIRRVVSATLQIARSDFGHRVDVQRKDEIGELAHAFNYMSAQLATYDSENKRLYQDLQRGYLETIRALANSIDAKDPYTRGHSQRVTEYAVEIARELKLDEEEIARIQFGGILHDIGKIGIQEKVLGKAAALTDEEYEYMKTHPLLGVGIVDPIDFLEGVKPIIRNHHERWDGKGYPDGQAGESIDIGARIVSIADAWDAMVTHRSYNVPMTYEQGVARLRQIAGTQHDPRVTEAFLAVLSRRRAEEQEGEAWRSAQSNVLELPKRG